MNCKLRLFFFALIAVIFVPAFGQKNYKYETVPGDPLQAKIYTLSNGLKVYLSVYKDVPRIQTYIVVRTGSKNDPPETTGLAHYLEHLMFKGTSHFGTMDFAKEKPLLDQIENLFEVYRQTTNEEKRAAIYKEIDSISYLASGYAIPNEYVKMMKYIGSTGTNAWTSNDNTVYLEQIPSNQLENWAMIQGDRFKNQVFRLFHTELETIYEEKNRSLTNDNRRASEAMLAALFPNHPYGTQTTLGTAEHLRNPSLVNIKKFVDTYYVPNNMAICLAGDFDPDEAVAIIEKYFGDMQPKELPPARSTSGNVFPQSQVNVEVAGNEAEFLTIAFPINKPANDKEMYILRMLDYILSNGKSGLIDLNINLKQRLSSASSYPYILCDNSAYILTGKPRETQNLDEVAEILLDQVRILRNGQFDESLMRAALNNIRLQEMRQIESNSSRASKMSNAFMNNIPWEEACNPMKEYEKISKEDILAFAKKYLDPDKCIIVRKIKSQPSDIQTVKKPPITPIQINRDSESDFFKQLKQAKVTPIEPVFVDYPSAIQFADFHKMPVASVKNVENSTFDLRIVYPIGEMMDKNMPIVADYTNFLSTKNHSQSEIKQLFYELACNFSAYCSDDEFVIRLSGLSENFDKALQLTTDLMENAVMSDNDDFSKMIETRVKNMYDAQHKQDNVLSALRIYGEYGPELVKYSLKPDEMKALSGQEIFNSWQELKKNTFKIYYYGPLTNAKLKKSLDKNFYKLPAEFLPIKPKAEFKHREVTENQVLFVPYDAKQSRLVTYSNGPLFNAGLVPVVTMYNTYFGGGMNAIVFQEMREKRSLAYTAQSSFITPAEKDEIFYNYSFIGTQNDKVIDAWEAFDGLFNQMPLSESAFTLAKENLKTTLASTRYTKMGILTSYISNQKKGYNYDYRKDVYNAIDGFSLDNISKFNAEYVKDKPKIYMMVARQDDIDFRSLKEKFGPVQHLNLKDIFGY